MIRLKAVYINWLRNKGLPCFELGIKVRSFRLPQPTQDNHQFTIKRPWYIGEVRTAYRLCHITLASIH